jgi:diadenosine tetraphosphate (Ap4A) HIT family hydrolase
MSRIKLDPRLAADTHVLGSLPGADVLLHRNAGVAWCIVVPDTERTELVDLDPALQVAVQASIQQVAAFLRREFVVDKLNIAAIGNIVSQLHVHVIGRRRDDYCWPGVVWGTAGDTVYSEAQVAALRAAFNIFANNL